MNSYTNMIKAGIRRVLSAVTIASAFMLTAWTATAQQVSVTEVAIDGGEEQSFNSGTIRIRVYLDSEITADTVGSPYILLSNIKNFAGGATEFKATYAGDGRAQGDADCLFFQYAIQAGDYSTGIELSGTIVMPSGSSITTEAGTITSGIALPVGEEDAGSLTDNGYIIKINTFYFEGFLSTITVPESRCKVGKSFSYVVYGGGNLSGNVAFLVTALSDEDAEVTIADQTGSQKTLSTGGGDVFNATMSDSGTMTITVTPQSEASDVTIRIRPASASGDSSADLTLVMEEITVNSPTITRIFALSGDYAYPNVGDQITIGMEFSERITAISGTPLLYLNVYNQNNNQTFANNNTFANYAKCDEANYPHSGKIMYFTYTVKAGDYIGELDATRLALNGATITCSSGRADGTTLASLPKGETAGSLASENDVSIRTIVFSDSQLPTRSETIVEDLSYSYIITRGAAVNADQSFSVTADPANGDKVTFNSSFTIPAGSQSAEFVVTAIEATEGTTQKINLHPTGYSPSDTTGDIVLEFTITPSPTRPAVKISGVATLNEGDGAQLLNVALSKAPKENITVTITSSNPDSLPIIDCDLSVGTMQGNTAVMTFPAGLVGPYTITVDPRDGLDAANNSITIHATADKTYAEYNHIVRVLNVDPTFSESMVGEEGWILTPRSARSPGVISWSAKDVSSVDLTHPLKAEVDFGDGSAPVTVNCTAGGSGSVMHTYMQANLAGYSVRVTVTDKDGGSATIEGNVIVTAPTTALIQEYKDGGNRYNGLAGLGQGSIVDNLGTEREALHGNYDWQMYYNSGCGAVIFLANPSTFEEDGLIYDSFVHKWIGDSFVAENVLDPTLHLGSAMVNVDEDTTAFTVGAVFSREHYPEDNYADIDWDELPDDWESSIAWGTSDVEGTYSFESTVDPYGRMSNVDGDFFPAIVAGIDVETGDFQYRDSKGKLTTDITQVATFNFTPIGIAFGNVYEVRGTHHGLNARGSDPDAIIDEPHIGSYDENNEFTDSDSREFFGTDPTLADTDGDWLSDGWEYFFWRYGKFGGVGEAYNPTTVVTGDEIDSLTIEAAFNPCVPGSITADLDGDGLSNFEEMLLGTNPIDWDTDGDTMNDGWEVMWGLDPASTEDASANPDGDYMADDGQGNIHADVYVKYGFDPRTAWNATYKERNRQISGYAAFSTSPNTRAYNTLDEYSLAVWCIEKGITEEVEPMSTEFMTQPVPYGTRTYRIGKSVTYTEASAPTVGEDGTYSVPKGSTTAGESTYYVVTSTEITTHGSDTDSDGMPDGWELYMSAMPEFDMFAGEYVYHYRMVVWPTSAKEAFAPTIDADFDNLTSIEECHSTELCEYYFSINTNFPANVNGNWYNKWWPTDIWNADTDGDRLSDGQEGDETFRYQAEMSIEDLYDKFGANTMLRGHVPGGGLNPCAVDTDMDYIPDVWEYQFAGIYRDTKWEGGFCNEPGTLVGGGMDGTYFDSRSGIDEFYGRDLVTNGTIVSTYRNFDFDGDGLENYQEYWVGAVHHFQYDKWEAGKGYGGYDPMQIFRLGKFAETKEIGYYKVGDTWAELRFLTWDWSAFADDWQNAGLPGPELDMGGNPAFQFHYIRAEQRPKNPFAPVLYPDASSASTDPRLADTDADNMDDYYEMFHGLNPILGEAVDMVNLPDEELQLPGSLIHTNYNFHTRPWLIGMPNADPDQDGLPNWEEALSPNQPAPANYNTDPSPMWFTDISNPESFVNLYYKWGSVFNYWCPEIEDHPQYDIHPSTALMNDMWMGDVMLATNRSSYVYSFEVNEGFDTDNDNISDRSELTGITNRVTDPQNGDRPALRKAAYLDGKSAFRTRALSAFGIQCLRSWTLEAWIRPEEPASGKRQIIMERPVQWIGSDTTPVTELIRRTFRLGLDEYGKPFVEFNNGAQDFITEAAIAPEGAALDANEWYHIAATMDGYAKKLKLYINGELVATKSTSVIPYTGFTYSAINGVISESGSQEILSPRWAPIVVGAAEANALGRIGEEPFFTSDGGAVHAPIVILGGQPQLSNFFKGYIDDIRIWTGARPGGEDNGDQRIAKWGWPTIKSDFEDLKRYGLKETLDARNDMVKYFMRVVNERKLAAGDSLDLNASTTNNVAGTEEEAGSTTNSIVTWTLLAEGMTFEEFYETAQSYIAMTGGENNEIRVPPLLLCSYTFDNLPDPNVEPVLPAKFDAINGRPEDYDGIQWLDTAADKTTVYVSDEKPPYIFAQLVENHVASLPLGRLYGYGIDEEYEAMRSGSNLGFYKFRPDRSANSKYWTRDTKGGVSLEDLFGTSDYENSFPNTSNPYRTRYETANHFDKEAHPQLTTAVFFDPMHAMLFNDLVPLNNACADMSIQLWDDPMGNGIGAVLDTDGDGLPDWWELANGLDPYNSDTNSNGVLDAYDDFDGDGLNNYSEYLIGTDPYDSTTNGNETDDVADTDNDGLSNLEEILIGTDPANPDTDDDGLTDGEEVASGSSPVNSLSPFRAQYLSNKGNGVLTIPGPLPYKRSDGAYLDRYGERFNLENWTIDMAVRPTAAFATNVVLLRRTTEPNGYVSYELGLSSEGIPYIRFQSDTGEDHRVEGVEPLEIGAWTFLGGRFGPSEQGDVNELTLFVDGKPIVRDVNLARSASGMTPEDDGVTIAQNFAGDIDEVRIWNYAVPNHIYLDGFDESIIMADGLLGLGSLKCNSKYSTHMLYDDAQGEHVFPGYTNFTVEAWVKCDSTNSQGVIIRRVDSVSGLLNFELAISTEGYLEASYHHLQEPTYNDYALHTLQSINKINDGKWHHVAFSSDYELEDEYYIENGIIYYYHYHGMNHNVLYVDGVLQAKSSIRGLKFAEKGSLVEIGARQGDGKPGFSGNIDEIRVYSTAQSEIFIREHKDDVLDLNIEVFDSLEFYFDFDGVNTNTLPIYIPNRADMSEQGYIVVTEELNNRIENGRAGNAPVRTNPLSLLLSKLALYLPFEDGTSYRPERIGQVEDYGHRILGITDFRFADNDHYCGQIGLTTDMTNPSYRNSIDFASYDTIRDRAPFSGYYTLDSDNDNLPDYWEMSVGMDQYSKLGDNECFQDFDNDGLINFYEYLAATDPYSMMTDHKNIDGYVDADSDGLVAKQEQSLGTHPLWADSDDDGISDGDEIHFGTDPLDASVPYFARAIYTDGALDSYVTATSGRYCVGDEFAKSFELSTQIYPLAYPAEGATIVSRQGTLGNYNYFITLDGNGIVSAGFTKSDDGTIFTISAPTFRSVPLNAWTRVDFKLDCGDNESATQSASLWLDGEQIAFVDVASLPVVGNRRIPNPVIIGSGFAGFIRNVKLTSRNGDAIYMDFRMNDGTSYNISEDIGAFGTAIEDRFGQVDDFAALMDIDRADTNAFKYAIIQRRITEATTGSFVGNVTFVDLDENLEPEISDLDTDGDGLSDAWEMANGLNPFNADSDGDGILDGDEDNDLDGLSNYYEYLAGTNPNNAKTDGTTFDGNADSDGDGLSNGLEELYGTHPAVADSDDDGIVDGDEVFADLFTLPSSSLSPARQGVLELDGTGFATITNEFEATALRLNNSWTIEGWVKLEDASSTGVVVRRGTADGAINYELSLDSGIPQARIQGIYEGVVDSSLEAVATAETALVADEWTHLAAVWNSETRNLALYINGVLAAEVESRDIDLGIFSASGALPLVIGEGIVGSVDEIRIWDIARSGMALGETAYKTFEYASTQPLVEFRFDDFGETAENFGSAAIFFAELDGATMVEDETSPIAADEFVDSDADGIADFWEFALFGDTMSCVPADDLDGDGLSNLYEFLAQTHPFTKYTGDANYGIGAAESTSDAARDPDGDGLANIDEQRIGTNPMLADTDDDGLNDYTEINGVTIDGIKVGVSDPNNALSPARPGAMSFDGTGRIVEAARDGKSLSTWTLSAWIRPADGNTTGAIVSRSFADGSLNYELGVETVDGALVPYARYTTSLTNDVPVEIKAGLGIEATTIRDSNADWMTLDSDKWVHLAATYTGFNEMHAVTNGLLKVYVDGTAVAWRQDALTAPFTGAGAGTPLAGEQIIGEGFKGLVDDVRVSGFAATDNQVLSFMGGQRIVSIPQSGGTNEIAYLSSAAITKVAGEYIVRFRDGITRAASASAVTAHGGIVKRSYSILNAAHVIVPAGVDTTAFATALAADPTVLYVEPNRKRESYLAPNDADYSKLWGLKNDGQTGGTAGCDINAEAAWNYLTGDRQVVVAVIDTGIDYNHPDLVDNMWINENEIPGDGIDNDENGYVDDVYGIAAVNGVSTTDPLDDEGHGTHCAGTIAGVGNNGRGVAGVNWRASLMALKFLGADGGGYDSDAIACIEYAVQMGADVINASWGGPGYSQALYDAIALCDEAGIAFIAAAGNDGVDNDVQPSYPAAFDLENIIAVAATDHNDDLAWFSNYGAESVDIAAPGVDIYSTLLDGTYGSLDGTSMATPHVAGAVALMLAADPTLTPAKIKELVIDYADPVVALDGKCVSGGRLNIGTIIPIIFNPGTGSIESGEELVSWYRFDDHGKMAQNFAANSSAKLEGGVAFIQNDGDDTLELIRLFGDSDSDSLPDWWEELVGFDPFDAVSNGGRNGDPDGDGLSNFYEYRASLACFMNGERGLSPFNADTDNDGVFDRDEDSDNDGITNIEEQDKYLSDPASADSDDDGVLDGAELGVGYNPTASAQPYIVQALTFSGADDESNTVVVKDKVDGRFSGRFASPEWTIEGWFNVDTASMSGEYALISRKLHATDGVNYELGIANGKPYARYTDHQGNEVRVDAGEAITAGTWTHIAACLEATESSMDNVLTLFVDGSAVAAKDVAIIPTTEPGDLVFGSAGFKGQMFNLRIWKIAQSDVSINAMMRSELLGGKLAGMSGVLTVTGNGFLKESATTLKADGMPIDVLTDSWTLECWVKTTAASGIIMARRNSANSTVGDFNYAIEIAETGAVRGRFSIWFTYIDERDEDGNPMRYVTAYNDTVNNLLGEIRINDGKWHHIAYVRSDTQCKLYVDGILDASQAPLYVPGGYEIIDADVRAVPGPVVIGEKLVGSIEETRIWNRDLSTAEIKEYSHVNLTGSEQGLISYFNFDFEDSDTSIVAEHAIVRNINEECGIFIRTTIEDAFIDSVTAGPSNFRNEPIRAVQNITLAGAFFARDGGISVEDLTQPMSYGDFLGIKYTGILGAGVTFAPQAPESWVAKVDSDGDSMTDAWEIQYGLDPYLVDQDGNGITDTFDDFDDDGLSNFAENLAGTDPLNPDTDSNGTADYYESPFGGLMYGELFTDNDHVLDGYEAGQDSRFASPYRYDEHLDRDLDGWNNWSEALVGTRLLYNNFNEVNTNSVEAIIESTVEDKVANFPMPTLSTTLHFTGDAITGSKLVIHAYSDAEMNGWPDAVIVKDFTANRLDTFPMTVELTKDNVVYGHLRQGKNWFFAWMEKDGSSLPLNGGNWPTWTPGEPAAVADFQVNGIDIGWDYNPVAFHLAVDAHGYVRYSFQQPPNGSATIQGFATDGEDHRLSISCGGTTLVSSKLIKWPRVWIHEGDLQVGKTANYGVTKATANSIFPNTYELLVDNYEAGVVTNWFTATTLAAPTLQSPINYEVVYAGRPEFQFYLPEEATEFEVSVTRYSDAACTTGAAKIYSACHPAPLLETTGSQSMITWQLPFSVGGPAQNGKTFFYHGYYYKWTVKAYNAANTDGTLSSEGIFKTASADEQNAHAKMGQVSTKVLYPANWAYGSGGAPYVFIQAFDSASFNGTPVYTTRTPAPRVSTLYGLEPNSSVNLIAFIDQNGNGLRDAWEPYGYYRDPISAAPFMPVAVTALTTGNNEPYEIVLRDPDTDNDLIPDSLEYVLYGGEDFLSKSGKEYTEAFRSQLGLTGLSLGLFSGMAADADGDGINDLAEAVYGLEAGNSDSDGDGISDGDEVALFGSIDAASTEQSLTVTGLTLGDNGEIVVEWGWDGVDTSDEGLALSSTSKIVSYDIEATDSLTEPNWQVVKSVSTTVLDGATEIGSLEESTTGARFFRVVFKSVE